MSTTDQSLRDAADRYNRRLMRDLIEIECALEVAREHNARERARGWWSRVFGGPVVIVPMEYWERAATTLRDQLTRERARIAAACPCWASLGGAPSVPKGTES
jgi:hypothetical protein